MRQHELPEMTDTVIEEIRFADVYSSKSLGSTFDEMEVRYKVTDKIAEFKSLVNPSLSKDQPYHRWARYREAYSGDIVKKILGRLDIDPKTDYVVDPMCGSGSTNVACKEIGIASVGLDVSDYSVLMTNVKTEHYKKISLKSIYTSLDNIKAHSIKRSQYFNDLERYFSTANLSDLELIHAWISQVSDPIIRDLLKVAWLAIVEDCSNRKKDGNGLATRISKVTDVQGLFKEQVEKMLSDIKNHPLQRNVYSEAFKMSALDMRKIPKKKIASKKIGAIVFSPPYANSFDYFESYKMELVLGGFYNLEELKGARKSLIRNYRLNRKEKVTNDFDLVEKICAEIEKSIPIKEKETGVRDGRNRLVPIMLRCYFDDMHKMLAEGYSALRYKGAMSIVVDQSAYLGIPVPTDLILARIAEHIGYRVTSIDKCRRAATSGQQLKRHPYLKHMLRESIVNLEK